jgi:hypothetical protein
MSIQIRTAPGDRLLWLGGEGLLSVRPELITEMLAAVPTHEELTCEQRGLTLDCYQYDRKVYDHVLETTPPQRISHGVRTQVTTPRGAVEIVWTARDEVGLVHNPLCNDGVMPRSYAAFAASLVAVP